MPQLAEHSLHSPESHVGHFSDPHGSLWRGLAVPKHMSSDTLVRLPLMTSAQ